eukprot:scaffold69443_cov36-Phaeocystis_antarctica.AAC.1
MGRRRQLGWREWWRLLVGGGGEGGDVAAVSTGEGVNGRRHLLLDDHLLDDLAHHLTDDLDLAHDLA